MARKTTRRPRGEGSITRVGTKWVVRFWNGKRRLQRTCTTQAAALEALTELRKESAAAVGAPRTVSQALDAFLAVGTSARNWAPATARSYGVVVAKHLRPALGERPLRELSVRDVEKLMEQMVRDGHSARHVGYVRGVLRAALRHAERDGVVTRNVAALATPPPARRAEMTALSIESIGALFDALEGHWLRGFFVTAATLGLRRGELIALRWDDVDLDGATLTVRRTGARIGGEYVEGHPKSEKSRRTLVLPASVVGELRRQRALIASERLRRGVEWSDEDRVFPGEWGGPLGQTTIRKALDAALSRAGLPHVRVHDLRHTAATSLLTAGGSLRDVQEMLGHTSYSLTADVYAHVLDEQRRATAERIEAVLGAAIRI